VFESLLVYSYKPLKAACAVIDAYAFKTVDVSVDEVKRSAKRGINRKGRVRRAREF